MLNEGVKFVHLDHPHLLRSRGCWQLGGIGFDPVRQALGTDPDVSGDPPQVIPVGIQSDRFQTLFRCIAILTWFWCVEPFTSLTPVLLAS